MSEQEKNVVRCLKHFATAMMSEKSYFAEDVVDKFMDDAQIAFSEEGRQELINHIKALL